LKTIDNTHKELTKSNEKLTKYLERIMKEKITLENRQKEIKNYRKLEIEDDSVIEKKQCTICFEEVCILQ
jgi:hypothetical protein